MKFKTSQNIGFTTHYLEIPETLIEWILNASNYDKLCQNAREKVLKEFDSVVVAKKYIELYEGVLKND